MTFLDNFLFWLIIAIVIAVVIFYLAYYGLDRYYASRDQKEEKTSSNGSAKNLVPGIGGDDDSGPGNFIDVMANNQRIAITVAAIVAGAIAIAGSIKIFTKQEDNNNK